MRFLYLDWPHLCHRLELARARQAPLDELVVIGGQPWEAGTVLDCSPSARRLGVLRGQPLGTAHRLVPEAQFLPADHDAYRGRMDAALEEMARFTPSVESDSDPEARTFGQILLGIEGLHRLWGDEPRLTSRIVAAVRAHLPDEPRLGIGNTRFGAQVAAVVGRGTLESIPIGDAAAEAEAEAAYLAPLSITLLPANDETRERLRVFGLTRIGEFAALARSSVIARFGEHGGMLHDLARGMDGRVLRPRRAIERLAAEAELEPPVDSVEPLRFVLRNLCGALCEQLNARGAGATRAVLVLELERGLPLVLEQVLPEPAASPDLLERLLVARLIAESPRIAVTKLSVELRGEQVVSGQQLGLFAPQLARAARLDWQLTGLALRFGVDRLLRTRILDPEATLPELRVEWTPATTDPLSLAAASVSPRAP
ncbi:MAG TPA: DNA polymerase Y family protein [Candidatus Limnocylindrales bacterium]|nr:DNA polymerase Y family protein [Candidatus Limnocylindrales bacterium]